MPMVQGFGASSADSPLAPMSFERRETGPRDVKIDILYCGVCHSDLHQARNEWHSSIYPCVPGHEIVGRVVEVGKKVKKVKEGDVAAVGCMVGSCRKCASCEAGDEQYCENGAVYTYNSVDPLTGGPTFGGYSSNIVVDKGFVLKVPDGMPLAESAPLLCAGITTYSPLVHFGVERGSKVGVVGLGGLGHMAVKIARAMGAHVVVFTTSPKKVEDAKRLGAHDVVVSSDEEAMSQWRRSLDFILDTVSAVHDLNAYLRLLRKDGTMCLVGLPGKPVELEVFNLLGQRRTLTASSIGGIRETQEMLDFCADHRIVADIETIAPAQINDAFERLLKNDVKYRFVIDMSRPM